VQWRWLVVYPWRAKMAVIVAPNSSVRALAFYPFAVTPFVELDVNPCHDHNDDSDASQHKDYSKQLPS
jgi:hypothetical protein